MKLVRVFTLCLVIAFLCACRPILAVPKPTSSSPETSVSGPKNGQSSWTLTCTRSGGFAGLSQTVVIESDGRLLDGQGQEKSAPADAVSALIAEINQLDFSSFDGEYGDAADCRDCYTYTLTLEQGGETKTITIVEDGTSKLPEALQDLLQNLNVLASVG
jgi:hypothetical protein